MTMKLDYADEFTSYDENIIRVNCERMIDISSEIELVNDWAGKDNIIELVKSQIEQLKCEVIYMKNDFQIRSLLIRESKNLADVYDSNENNNNINILYNSTLTSSTTSRQSCSTTTSNLATHNSPQHQLSSQTAISILCHNHPIPRASLKKTIRRYPVGKKAYYQYAKVKNVRHNMRTISMIKL